eukprot:1628592-Pyramimonas_sp.AAC.1
MRYLASAPACEARCSPSSRGNLCCERRARAITYQWMPVRQMNMDKQLADVVTQRSRTAPRRL